MTSQNPEITDWEPWHAVIIDESYDTVILRDALTRAAEHYEKLSGRQRNIDRARVLRKYAERVEDIRQQEVAAWRKVLGLEG